MERGDGLNTEHPHASDVACLQRKHFLRRLYDWVLHWAETPQSQTALFLLAFAESSFFPIPPDVLLIALALGRPKHAFRFAFICSMGSVLGGMFGYFLGLQFFNHIGKPILTFYGGMDGFVRVQELYRKYDALAVTIAGFTPIPYKLFTIAGGAVQINFTIFVIASFLSRAARFFLVGGVLRIWGPPARAFIERYFNILSIIFVLLLIGGFLLLKHFL